MEVPGAERQDLEINVEKNVLSIEGRINLPDHDNLKPLYTEYRAGHFRRNYSLSNEIDQKAISATVENGVLFLTLPKAKDADARRIEVQ
jgi:HSP20 family protein